MATCKEARLIGLLRFVPVSGRPSGNHKKVARYPLNCKPLSSFKIVGFVDGHKKLATVAREVNFGAAVASTFWTERLAIGTATSMVIPVRNYLVHVWQFQCEIVFWW